MMWLIGAAGVPVRAAQAQAPSGAAQDQFVPVSPNDLQQEQLPATPLVFTAYAFVWVVLIVYVFMLWRRIGRVEREIAALQPRPDRRP
jgi:CcmD family protein